MALEACLQTKCNLSHTIMYGLLTHGKLVGLAALASRVCSAQDARCFPGTALPSYLGVNLRGLQHQQWVMHDALEVGVHRIWRVTQ